MSVWNMCILIYIIVSFFVDVLKITLEIFVYNLTFTSALKVPTTATFQRHANLFCSDVSIVIIWSQELYTRFYVVVCVLTGFVNLFDGLLI